jgi:hypothetical protein
MIIFWHIEPLLGKDCETKNESFSERKNGSTIEGGVFYVIRFEAISCYQVQFSWCLTRVEAGSNTSTVTLRVVGGDEKGSLKSETVKDGHESEGTRTRERLRWQGPAAYTKTDPSSRQRGRPTKIRP